MIASKRAIQVGSRWCTVNGLVREVIAVKGAGFGEEPLSVTTRNLANGSETTWEKFLFIHSWRSDPLGIPVTIGSEWIGVCSREHYKVTELREDGAVLGGTGTGGGRITFINYLMTPITIRLKTPKEVDNDRLTAATAKLGPNATALLADIADRLVIGKAHGDFEKPLNWTKEAYEEDLDGIVYRAMRLRQVAA